ncbi:MAG: hypothetical protein HY305_01405 [Sphingobacteriales bacterium]|nr:hypothetical protein [Sphingobacteriales bacterium]
MNVVTAQSFDSLLSKLDQHFPQEKVYLHLDKTYYAAGETVWLKAYLTAANLPSAISKTIYAELLDAKGKIIDRKIMPVIKSTAASCFDLPDSVNGSLLYIRSYTSWMLNFDSTSLYLQPVHIINNNNQKKPALTSFSLSLFPEGGDLITGITSRVAFKANDQSGIPINVEGNIIDNKGNKVVSFSAVHDGMGYFLLTPLLNEKYKAVWKDKKGIQHETPLPLAKKEGIALHIENVNNEVTYTVQRPDTVSEDFKSCYIVAQMQQQLVYNAQINMRTKTTITAPIITDSLEDGIVQVTVFNAAKIPVAERIFFINRNNYSFITDLHAPEKNLTKKGKNILQVDVGGTAFTNLSISVTDEGVNPAGNKEENIFSKLLLTSDLKGYVYNTAYYFSADEDSVRQHLDLVMQTNGWRRFKWEDIMANNWPVIKYQPENYLTLQGNVYGLSQSVLTGKELSGILKTAGGGSEWLSLPVAKDGQFKAEGLYFFDTARLYYQFNNDKDKKLTAAASFSFGGSFIKAPVIPISAAIYLPEEDTAAIRKSKFIAGLLNERHKSKMLDVVTVKVRQKTLQEKKEEQYASGFFKGGDGIIFAIDDDPFARSSFNVLNYLQNKVAGLQLSQDEDGNPVMVWRGSQSLIFLNEVSSDINMVKFIPLTDVAMIKVFRPPFFGSVGSKYLNRAGGNSAGGAIAVYTKKGADITSTEKGLGVAVINGYSSMKQFYSPDYDNNGNDAIKDYRTTLYWNPFLLMDKNNRRITIPFYNSDNCKKIRIVIEGMNELGKLTREEKILE